MAETKDANRLRRIVSIIGAAVLGLVLVIAALGKLGDPVVFVEQIRTEGLAIFFSANTVALIALGLEMGLGLALLLGVRSIWVLAPTSLLVALFVFLTGRNYWLVLMGQRDPSYDCGCFGVFMERTAVEAFWQDLFLLVPPLIMAFASRRAVWKKPSAWRMGVSLVGAVAIVLYTSFAIGLPPEVAVEGPESTRKDLFQVSGQFELMIDGEKDPEGRVYESNQTLEMIVTSSRFEEALMLDIRSSEVFRIPETALHISEEGVELSDLAPRQEVGSFEVGSAGISFTLGDRRVQIQNP